MALSSTVKTKKCCRCKTVQLLDNFYRNRARTDGHNTICKKCSCEVMIQRRKENPMKYRLRDKECRRRRFAYVWAMASLYKHRMKGLSIDMSIKELEKIGLESKTCSICGRRLNWTIGSKNNRLHDDSPTLDRIDGGNTISKNSVWIVCHECNRTKGGRSMSDFVNYCRRISQSNIALRRIGVSQSGIDRDMLEGCIDTPQEATPRTAVTLNLPNLFEESVKSSCLNPDRHRDYNGH